MGGVVFQKRSLIKSVSITPRWSMADRCGRLGHTNNVHLHYRWLSPGWSWHKLTYTAVNVFFWGGKKLLWFNIMISHHKIMFLQLKLKTWTSHQRPVNPKIYFQVRRPTFCGFSSRTSTNKRQYFKNSSTCWFLPEHFKVVNSDFHSVELSTQNPNPFSIKSLIGSQTLEIQKIS